MSRMAMIVTCLFFAAGPAAAQSDAAIQEAVQKAGEQWAAAYNKADAEPLAALYTEDAYLLPPGADIVRGRSAIEDFWRQHIGTDFKYTTIDIKALGDKAAREIGTVSFRTNDQQLYQVKYAVVWVNNGGQWQLLQDIWNA